MTIVLGCIYVHVAGGSASKRAGSHTFCRTPQPPCALDRGITTDDRRQVL